MAAQKGAVERGRNRAGVTTKLHLVATPENHVIEGMLTGGNVADVRVANDITADIVGWHVLADMDYNSDPHRRMLESNNNIPVIPGRKNGKIPIVYDKTLYKLRRRIEIFFGKIKENRRLAVRYEKLDTTFLSFIAFATISAFNLC